MSDTLTDHLAKSVKARAPFVFKYVPYGALSEVHFFSRPYTVSLIHP